MEIKNIRFEQNFDLLFFLGDIHADFHVISYFLHSNDLKNVLIFQVGDFGIGYFERQEKSQLIKVNEVLVERNSKVVAIRGNHDNPMYFEKDRYGFSNIHFLSDYTVLNLILHNVEINILGIGGAISIDRIIQQQKKYWFVDEVVKFITDSSTLNSLKNNNIIVTHTAPDFVPPFTFNGLVESYCAYDKPLKGELIQEREKMSKMIDYLINVNKDTLTNYYYGHFHSNNHDEYKDVKFECLNIGQFKEYRNSIE